MRDLESRALAAYFRHPQGAQLDQPAPALTEIREVDGARYVILHNGQRALAGYRVRGNGMLARIAGERLAEVAS